MVKTLPIAELFFCCETINMFLRSYKRKKNGKWHEYFSVVENRRVANGKTVQRTVLYLGEITSSQEDTWKKRWKFLIRTPVNRSRNCCLPMTPRSQNAMSIR